MADRIKVIEQRIQRAEDILTEKGAPLESTSAGQIIVALRDVVELLKEVIPHEIDDPTQQQ